jgi:hypothetical protein
MLIIQFTCLTEIKYLNYVVPIVCSLAIISSGLNYILNPGIIYSLNKSNEKIHCSFCKMYYPKTRGRFMHCDICNICISGYDHHCGVIGKCVGKFNMPIFIILPFSGMGFFICLVLVFFSLVVPK